MSCAMRSRDGSVRIRTGVMVRAVVKMTCEFSVNNARSYPQGGLVENISLHSVYDTTKCTRDGDMLTAGGAVGDWSQTPLSLGTCCLS